LDLQDREPAVAPLAAAGVLLAARTLGAGLELALPTATAIVEATGVTRSRAYEVRDRVWELLPTLVRPPGRPPAPPEPVPTEPLHALREEALDFIMAHPGCVDTGGGRARYADVFRHFVLALRERHADVPLPAFAEAIRIPFGTLQDWLRPGAAAPTAPEPEPEREPDPVTVAHVETVLSEWRRWQGKELGPFVAHLRRHHHLPFGTSAVGRILFEHGERTPARRAGRRHADEHALRRAFETFFPGAQWVADGTRVVVTVDGVAHGFNLELIVDAHTGAWVGLDVRDEEDAEALVAALAHGEGTTGAPPLSLLVDNRESNLTDEVADALGDALRLRATPGRGQNKAHVEGAFGLFEQQGPPLVLRTGSDRELARQLLRAAADAFARGLNGRPRRDRGGNSRADLYDEPVTDAEREQARERLRERFEAQERGRQTRERRRDPAVAAYLDDAFDRLGLSDPHRAVRDAVATHRLSSVVEAVAIFEGKKQRDSLPERAGARYLLGIVKNLDHWHDADAITEAHLRERLAMRDRLLEPLVAERDGSCQDADPRDALRAFTDRALATDRTLEEHFWLDAAADLVRHQPESEWRDLFRSAARRIHATLRVARQRRSTAERRLLRRIWPLD